MPELITIPISYFEATFEYKEPNLLLWLDRPALVQVLFVAFKPWNITVDDVEIITTGKPSDQGIKFKLPQKQVSFFFSPSVCRFTKDNADWSSTEETIGIMDTAYSTLVKAGNIETGTIKTIIALHMQPKTVTFLDILKPFIPPQLTALDNDVKTFASIIKWGNHKLILDGSGQLANGLFLRFERDFAGTATYEEIAHQLRADEEALFAMLGVEEELP
jgi:hypothetical protein